MAPIDSSHLGHRQFILPPRPAKGPPGGARPVASFISLKSFISLLVASFCIFVLAVVFWKLGAFLRAFSLGKVVGGGKAASVRYAKTWHGWVPLAEHNACQWARREKVNRFRGMMAWRSSHADYSWVWWDPGGRKLNQHFQNQRHIPSWLLSYTFRGSGAFQSTRPPLGYSGFSNSGMEKQALEKPKSTRLPTAPIDMPTGGSTVRRKIGSIGNKWKRPAVPRLFWPLDYTTQKGPLTSSWWANACTGGRHIIPDKAIEDEKLKNEKSQGPLTTSTHISRRPSQNIKRGRSKSLADLDCEVRRLTQRLIAPTPRRAASEGQQNEPNPPKTLPLLSQPNFTRKRLTQSSFFSEDSLPELPSEKTRSLRYKAWGAKMQRNAFDNTPVCLRGFAGRPGTPALTSMMSFGSGSEASKPITRKVRQSLSIESMDGSVTESYSHIRSYNTPRVTFGRIWGTDVPRTSNGYEKYVLPPRVNSFPRRRKSRNSDQVSSLRRRKPLPFNSLLSPPRSIRKVSTQTRNGHRVTKRRPYFRRYISNPEIRLIDDLDRKLEWLSSEMDPGRKHFPFLLLHNHWLNHATWVVLDPASRVDSKTRMLYGDPRVNYPFPECKGKVAKPKYPPAHLTKAHTPRLDSWRLAVNGARKSSGAREFLKAVELFDGSADELPGGSIDPASWILKKPPQGNEMSTNQKNAYFEGCGGWHEKLEDWQHVPRAYRARKVIFEGKANRRRVAELARAVGGTCKKTARRVTPSRVSRRHDEKGTGRQDRSGRGSIPRRFRLKPTIQLSTSAGDAPPSTDARQAFDGVCSQTEPQLDSEERDTG